MLYHQNLYDCVKRLTQKQNTTTPQELSLLENI